MGVRIVSSDLIVDRASLLVSVLVSHEKEILCVVELALVRKSLRSGRSGVKQQLSTYTMLQFQCKRERPPFVHIPVLR